MSDLIEARTHTALHVVKGAAQKVLGTNLTTGVYVNGSDGRLAVQCTKKPADDEIKRVELEANNCIGENKEVKIFEMERKDAEGKFGNEMYDAFPLPVHIIQLKMVQIADWNLNCCNKEHTKTTGDIGKIVIDSVRFRGNKQLLEISFKVV